MGTIYYIVFSSPIGSLYLAATSKGLWRICFGKRQSEEQFVRQMTRDFNGVRVEKNASYFKEIVSQLQDYFSGKAVAFQVPLDFSGGTDFQRRVWEELQKIPYGQVRSYRQVAEAIGKPRAIRAVGGANGANPIPIVVPCHRVINASGKLGGYSAGLGIKKKLLELEGISTHQMM